MTLDDANKLVAKLCSLFPQTTREQATVAGKDFRRFERETVVKALEEHARSHTFFTLSDLLKACDEAEATPPLGGRGAVPDQSRADIIRQRDEQLRTVDSDLEVILRSHRKQWHACGQRGDYRESILRQCTMALTGLPIDGNPLPLDMAAKWAETIFGDVEYFKEVLEDLRTRHRSGRVAPTENSPEWKQSLQGIQRHFEQAWQAVKSSGVDEHGRSVAQATIFRHAVMALSDLRINDQQMPAQEITEWALAFVGLAPGQRVAWPEAKFGKRIKIQQPQSSFEAISALARHEEAQKASPSPEPVASGSLSA